MDDIQQKLELIDKQLAGGVANFHKRIISTAPLLFAATGLIAGILIQNTLSLSIRIWLTLLALCAIATISYFAYRILQLHSGQVSHIVKKENLSLVLAYTALVCFVCLGVIRLTSFYQPRPNDIRNFVAEERKLATIRGLIVT